VLLPVEDNILLKNILLCLVLSISFIIGSFIPDFCFINPPVCFYLLGFLFYAVLLFVLNTLKHLPFKTCLHSCCAKVQQYKSATQRKIHSSNSDGLIKIITHITNHETKSRSLPVTYHCPCV